MSFAVVLDVTQNRPCCTLFTDEGLSIRNRIMDYSCLSDSNARGPSQAHPASKGEAKDHTPGFRGQMKRLVRGGPCRMGSLQDWRAAGEKGWGALEPRQAPTGLPILPRAIPGALVPALKPHCSGHHPHSLVLVSCVGAEIRVSWLSRACPRPQGCYGGSWARAAGGL